MTSLLIEDVSDETRRGLERLASKHGRSIEAEIQSILATAAAPLGMGSALAALGRRHGGIDLDITRDTTPGRAADFD